MFHQEFVVDNSMPYLVGGFNPLKKAINRIGSFPKIWLNIKDL